MKQFLRTTFLLVGLMCFMGQIANAQKIEKEIIGYWTLSKVDIKLTDYDKLNDEQKQKFESAKSSMLSEMEGFKQKAFFNFKKDGAMTSYDEQKGETVGTWKIQNDQLEIMPTGEEEGQIFTVKVEKGTLILILIMSDTDMSNMNMVMEMKKKQ